MKHAPAKTLASVLASSHWIKATVIYRNVYHLQAGLGLAAHLQLEGHAQMLYFARYTSPPFRLEYQILTTRSMATLRKAIMGYRNQNVSPLKVTFEHCNGSIAHAGATAVIMALASENNLTAGMLTDVVHWMFNMAGFSYVQEAGMLSIQAHTALRNVPGWSDQPIFGPHRVAIPNERPKHRALRRIKARVKTKAH